MWVESLRQHEPDWRYWSRPSCVCRREDTRIDFFLLLFLFTGYLGFLTSLVGMRRCRWGGGVRVFQPPCDFSPKSHFLSCISFHIFSLHIPILMHNLTVLNPPLLLLIPVSSPNTFYTIHSYIQLSTHTHTRLHGSPLSPPPSTSNLSIPSSIQHPKRTPVKHILSHNRTSAQTISPPLNATSSPPFNPPIVSAPATPPPPINLLQKHEKKPPTEPHTPTSNTRLRLIFHKPHPAPAKLFQH